MTTRETNIILREQYPNGGVLDNFENLEKLFHLDHRAYSSRTGLAIVLIEHTIFIQYHIELLAKIKDRNHKKTRRTEALSHVRLFISTERILASSRLIG